MNIIETNDEIVFDCQLNTTENTLTWNYSGNPIGFLIYIGDRDVSSDDLARFTENDELKESIQDASSYRSFDLKEEGVLLYISKIRFNNVLKINLSSFSAPKKVQILRLEQDNSFYLNRKADTIDIPLKIGCMIDKVKKKTGFLKKEMFCEIAFSIGKGVQDREMIKSIPVGAVYYHINGIRVPVDLSKGMQYSIYLPNESMSVGYGIDDKYKSKYIRKD